MPLFHAWLSFWSFCCIYDLAFTFTYVYAICNLAGGRFVFFLPISISELLCRLWLFQFKQEFAVGFKKTMAFQPRVIKQKLGNKGRITGLQSKECRCHHFSFKTYMDAIWDYEFSTGPIHQILSCFWASSRVSLFLLHFYARKVLIAVSQSAEEPWFFLVREFGSSNWRMNPTARLPPTGLQQLASGSLLLLSSSSFSVRFQMFPRRPDRYYSLPQFRPSIKCRIL